MQERKKGAGRLLRRALAVVLCAAMLVCAAAPAMAQTPAQTLRKVRVGYYSTPGFQEYDMETDTYSGYSYEYLLALAQYTNWTYEFVPVSFADGVSMLEKGQLDLMNNVSQTEERRAKLAFSSSPSGANCAYLATAPDNDTIAYEDYYAFNDITVGLVTTSIYSQRFLDYCTENGCMPHIVEFETKEKAMAALDAGTIDARIITSSQNVDMHIIAKFAPEDFYFAVPLAETDLLRELNQAMSSLKTNDPDFEVRLEDKYYSNVADDNTVLTDTEKRFIQENPVITVAYDKDCYPLSYTAADGSFAGTTAEIYALIAERTGLQFRYVEQAAASLPALTTADSVMLYAELPYDYVWAFHYGLRLTPPFTDITVMEARSTGNSKSGVMAVVEGYYLAEQCRAVYGDSYTYAVYPNTKACMEAVRSGKADITCLTAYEAAYYQSQVHYRALSFAVSQRLAYSLSIGVSRSADPSLFSIMLKGLNAISRDEIDALFRQTSLNTQQADTLSMLLNHPEVAIPVLVVMVLLLAGLAFAMVHTRTVRRKNAEIEQKNVQLADAVVQADRANTAKSQFLSRMSHEIRTPMNAIVGLTTIARRHEADPEKMDDYLSKIDASSHVLLNIINDVLDMSAIESNKLKIAEAEFDIKQVLTGIATIYYPQCENKGVQFVMATDVENELLMGDSLRVNQVLLNLVSNAYKFTQAGGTIRVNVQQTALQDGTAFLRFVVADTGCGMTPEMQQRLFRPFEQEDAETAKKHGGSGLGLSIAKNLVDMMHGAIRVESEKGRGTTFTVELPFRVVADRKTEKKPMAALRVLVVDADPASREYAASVLRRMGIGFDTADSGAHALALLDEADAAARPYDVCLLDWKLPDQSGASLVHAIRARAAQHRAVLIVSAYDLSEVEDAARIAGADHFVSKPLFQSTLFDVLMTLSNGTLKNENAGPEDYDFTGRRVLLAEDNEINAEIAIELLHMVNLELDRAADGKEAVALFGAAAPGRYDLILMDVQMPVMDGYAAARAIRALDRPDAKTVPIYAMTANAFTEDVAAALSAGMNGHIAKPIDTRVLYSTLGKAFAAQKPPRG